MGDSLKVLSDVLGWVYTVAWSARSEQRTAVQHSVGGQREGGTRPDAVLARRRRSVRVCERCANLLWYEYVPDALSLVTSARPLIRHLCRPPVSSFYPQVWLNYKRKSVTGLSFEYQAYNITGFLFYAVYSITDYIVQHDPKLGLAQSVEINDLVFVIHAVLITIFIIYQCVIYKLKSHTLNRWHVYLVCVFWILLAYNCALAVAGILPFVNRTQHYEYSVVEYLGYVKVIISFVKYCPQAYMNWSRQSTVGWSVGNVLLDLTGGLLSFGQQGLDAYRTNDIGVLTGNIAKLLLSLESVAFDLLFIVQHYVLYRGNSNAVAAQEAGLTAEEREQLEAATQAKARQTIQSLVPSALLQYQSLDNDDTNADVNVNSANESAIDIAPEAHRQGLLGRGGHRSDANQF